MVVVWSWSLSGPVTPEVKTGSEKRRTRGVGGARLEADLVERDCAGARLRPQVEDGAAWARPLLVEGGAVVPEPDRVARHEVVTEALVRDVEVPCGAAVHCKETTRPSCTPEDPGARAPHPPDGSEPTTTLLAEGHNFDLLLVRHSAQRQSLSLCVRVGVGVCLCVSVPVFSHLDVIQCVVRGWVLMCVRVCVLGTHADSR